MRCVVEEVGAIVGKRLVGLLTAVLLVCGVAAPVKAYVHEDFPTFMYVQDFVPADLSVILSYPCITRINFYWNPVGLCSYYIGSNEPIVVEGTSFYAVDESTGMQCFQYRYKSNTSGGLLDGGGSYSGGWISIEANYDLDLGELNYPFYRIDIGSGGSGGETGNDEPWVSAEHQARILSPRDGFKQQGVKVVNTRIYYNAPYDGNIKNLNIKVDGFKAEASKVVNNDYHIINDGASVEGFLQVEGVLKNWNVETEISATVTAYNGEVFQTAPVRVISYDDFVDEDGDGVDDRTGQDKWTGGSGDWTESGSGSVGDFDNIGDMLKSFTGSLTGLIDFIQEFFSFLPTPVFVILAVSVLLVVLLRIFGR